jgi:hypothetical protein
VTTNVTSHTNHDQNYEIRRVRTKAPSKHKRICITSGVANTEGLFSVCGKVHKPSWPNRNPGHVLARSIWIKTCRPGDSALKKAEQELLVGASGGPAYGSRTAYGILSSGGGCNYFIQHARDAQNAVNVDILPGP